MADIHYHAAPQQQHRVLYIPELVSLIMEHLIILGEKKKEEESCSRNITDTYIPLLQCMLVNRLWHDCAATIAWREMTFDKPCEGSLGSFAKAIADIHHDGDDNERLARKSMLSNCLDYLMRTPAADAWKRKSNDDALHHLHHPSAAAVATRLHQQLLEFYRKSVRSLALRKIKSSTINDQLERIAPYTSRVEQLDLYICDYLQSDTVLPFVAHGRLTHLSLAGCYRITDDVVIQAARQCPRLVHLDVRACGQISDRAIAEVAMHCPHLQHLNVGRVRNRDRISIASIRLVAMHTQVAVLGLAGCDIDDDCMRLLARVRNRHLERISVNSCPRISNATLRTCVQHCPNLSVLEIKECHRINDWHLVHWLQNQRGMLVTMCEQQKRTANAWADRRHPGADCPQLHHDNQ